LRKKVPFPVSIDDDLASWISDTIHDSEFRNKSHLVEQAIKEFLKKLKEESNE